ncbi:uncharacterized protein [Nicotiana tomentosiformis]|uniref:uncharacterized protein n=1 Tax=Nicotiana tomentosiformis TaxID=4098 RepID=UPI00388CBB8E
MTGRVVTGRPPLFDEHHYDEWKLRMEIFLQATDFDLWVIVSHGPILPTKMDSEGNKFNKREEEYNEEDRQLVQKMLKQGTCSTKACLETLSSECPLASLIMIYGGYWKLTLEMKTPRCPRWRLKNAKQRKNNLSCVKLDIKEIESHKANLEKQVKDLKNHVLELTSKNEKSPNIHGKGKMSDMQDKLEKILKNVKDNLCDAECRNKVLEENLEKSNYELSRLSKWHRSSDALNWLNENCSSNKFGIGYRKPVPKFDSKYIGIYDNNMCLGERKQYGLISRQWMLKTYDWRKEKLPLTDNLPRRECVIWKWEKGQITNVGMVGKSLSHAIEDVYYVVGLKYNLLSISQMCYKGNQVKFNSKICIVTKFDTDEIVLKGKRHNNVYKILIMSLPQSEHTCFSVVEDDPLLWHRRLGHASLSQLNGLAANDLVLGLPIVEFTSDKVCDARVRGKHVRSSFKSKKVVSSSKPLELLHMDQ